MSELISNFGIDWRMLLAQAVNFFILLFLLRMFAYKPILRMLKKRRQEIEKGLEYTKKAEEKLRMTDILREETINQAREQALVIVTEAEETGKKRREEMVQEANRKMEGVVADAKRVIEEEKAKMGEDVYKNARELVRAGIIRVLGKMSAEERNEPLIQEALEELKAVK